MIGIVPGGKLGTIKCGSDNSGNAPRCSSNSHAHRRGVINWRLGAPFAGDDRGRLLLKSCKRAILTSNPPGIWRMSLNSPFGDAPSPVPNNLLDGVDHDYRIDQSSDGRTF